MDWKDFRAACQEIGEPAEERFRRDQLVMLGTLRRGGMPRISPCEIDFAEGQMLVGMMWRSPKALDLLRDPRITVHSVTCNKDGTDGDVKVYGRARDVRDEALRSAFREAILSRINWSPEEPDYHLFAVDVESAAYLVFGGGQEDIMTWNSRDGFRKWSKSG